MRVACLWFQKPTLTHKLAELFLRFSPQICIRGDRAIFVEIGKCKELYSEESFRARTQILLRRAGASASIVIASEVTDSLACAMFAKSSVDELPLAALTEFADPFFRDVALRKSVDKMVDSFADLGVRSIGDFKKIPIGQLSARFGSVGRHCFNRAHLSGPVGWPSWRPEEIISERKEFPYFEFYGELDPILFELKTQLDQIFARLFSRKKRVVRLRLEIKCEKLSTHPNFLRTLDFDFFTPQAAVKGALRIVKERMTREFEKNPILSPIESIQITVLKTVEANSSQKNIFNADEEKQEAVSSIHNQLVEILGKECVFQAKPIQDRRPERSWVKDHTLVHEKIDLDFDLSETIPDRPTYLLKNPLRIEVTAGFLHIKQKRYKILNWNNNVERIYGGWFEHPRAEIQAGFDRSYYNVVIEKNQRIFVFKTPQGNYFLHGYYG